jgi:hypothetical protein
MSELSTPITSHSGEISTAPPLSQGERVIDTFIAPSKTFTDILRNQSWWLPFLIISVVGYGFIFTIDKRVGWEQVLENSLKANPAQAEKIANAPAEQQATIRASMMIGYKVFSYGFPVTVLLFWLIASAVMMGTINFIFGGRAKFGELFAVFAYAGLPGIFKSILTIIVLFAGLSPETFQLQNPVGTNLGYYLPAESPKWLITLGTSIDIITIWTVILLVIGTAIVAKVKKGTAAAAVVGWWVLTLLIGVGTAAAQG